MLSSFFGPGFELFLFSYCYSFHICFSEGVFIWLQISRDCQELAPSVGEQLASLLYLEPDSDLMVILLPDIVEDIFLNFISSFQSKCKLFGVISILTLLELFILLVLFFTFDEY